VAKETQYHSEKDVKKQVKKLLEKHSWFWWMPPANMYGKTGIPDFNAFRGGVFMVIETKFGKNEPTAMQLGFLHSIAAESGFAFVVNENRINWLRLWLEAFDRSIAASAKDEEPDPADGAQMLDAMKVLTAEIY
jgi:hypothetical protein